MTAYCGALRGAEYAIEFAAGTWSNPLLLAHLAVILALYIPRTKTRRFGRKVFLPCVPTQLCPFCIMIDYVKTRDLSDPNAPLFLFPDGTILSKMALNLQIQKLAALIGLDPALFSSHSIRSGAVTSASQLGLPEVDLKDLGDWSSQVYMRYIRNNLTQKNISHI